MKTLPIALVLCCGLTGIGLAGCQTVEGDGYDDYGGYSGRSYSTVEYGTGGYGRDYGYGYREPVRRAPPPRYVAERPRPQPQPQVWNGGNRNPPPTWGGGGRTPPPTWNGGNRNPPPQPQAGGGHGPQPVLPGQQRYQLEPQTNDIGR